MKSTITWDKAGPGHYTARSNAYTIIRRDDGWILYSGHGRRIGEPTQSLAAAKLLAEASQARQLCYCGTLPHPPGVVGCVSEPPLDRWCLTCGNPVGEDDRCTCWCLVADALQQYLGMDFDASADMAARLWTTEADKPYVWQARYADDHDVGIYPPPPLTEQDARNFPHDEPCPRCGRRQWGLGPDTEDPDNPSDAEQETCGACGYRYQEHER